MGLLAAQGLARQRETVGVVGKPVEDGIGWEGSPSAACQS